MKCANVIKGYMISMSLECPENIKSFFYGIAKIFLNQDLLFSDSIHVCYYISTMTVMLINW